MDISLLQKFVSDWTGRGYEKGETQPFWIALLAALGVEDPTQYIRFEDQVHLDHTSFIDGHIPATHVTIYNISFILLNHKNRLKLCDTEGSEREKSNAL